MKFYLKLKEHFSRQSTSAIDDQVHLPTAEERLAELHAELRQASQQLTESWERVREQAARLLAAPPGSTHR